MGASSSRGGGVRPSGERKIGRTGTVKKAADGLPTAKPTARAAPPHRSTGRRVTIEHQQEYRSRAQFDDRVTAFGWLVNTKDRDHGEDFSVDIYDKGQATGLSFSVQLKSTDDENRFVRKRDVATLAYRLDVADLKHWSVSAQLVVIVVWDVKTRSGTWGTVPEIVKQLRHDRGWRKQETVTIRLPRSNGTDDASLHRLRILAADHNYPIIKRGKKLRVSFECSFPEDDAGRSAAKALREAIDYGERAQIPGAFIKSWKMPVWWERLYGPVAPVEITLTSASNVIDLPARLEIIMPTGVHVVPIDLRRTKAGRHGLTLTNEHQRQPLDLALVARRNGVGAHVLVHIGVKHPVSDIFQTRDATALLLALHDALRLRLVNRETGVLIVESPVPRSLSERSVESLLEWKAFVEKLCFVQARIYKWGTIQIGDGRVSRREARLVEDFHTICASGRIERRLRFRAEFDLNQDTIPAMVAGVRRGERVEVGLDVPDAGTIQILNVEVPLGPMHARHDVASFVAQIERGLARGAPSVKVVVPDAVMREEYPNWVPATGMAAELLVEPRPSGPTDDVV